MQEALRLVQRDLGSGAAVLHTRALRGGILRRLMGISQVEVTASATVRVPSRFAEHEASDWEDLAGTDSDEPARTAAGSDAPVVPPAMDTIIGPNSAMI